MGFCVWAMEEIFKCEAWCDTADAISRHQVEALGTKRPGLRLHFPGRHIRNFRGQGHDAELRHIELAGRRRKAADRENCADKRTGVRAMLLRGEHPERGREPTHAPIASRSAPSRKRATRRPLPRQDNRTHSNAAFPRETVRRNPNPIPRPARHHGHCPRDDTNAQTVFTREETWMARYRMTTRHPKPRQTHNQTRRREIGAGNMKLNIENDEPPQIDTGIRELPEE